MRLMVGRGKGKGTEKNSLACLASARGAMFRAKRRRMAAAAPSWSSEAEAA